MHAFEHVLVYLVKPSTKTVTACSLLYHKQWSLVSFSMTNHTNWAWEQGLYISATEKEKKSIESYKSTSCFITQQAWSYSRETCQTETFCNKWNQELMQKRSGGKNILERTRSWMWKQLQRDRLWYFLLCQPYSLPPLLKLSALNWHEWATAPPPVRTTAGKLIPWMWALWLGHQAFYIQGK